MKSRQSSKGQPSRIPSRKTSSKNSPAENGARVDLMPAAEIVVWVYEVWASDKAQSERESIALSLIEIHDAGAVKDEQKLAALAHQQTGMLQRIADESLRAIRAGDEFGATGSALIALSQFHAQSYADSRNGALVFQWYLSYLRREAEESRQR